MKTTQNRSLFAVAVLLAALILEPSAVRAGTRTPAVTNIAVAAGEYHTLFLKSDGSLWGMGANTNGQLGIGLGPSLRPLGTNVPVQIISNGVAAIAAGANHSLFKIGGNLWGMGYNQQGQLGDGTGSDVLLPEKIFSSSSRISVTTIMAGGDYHSRFGTSSGILPANTGLWGMGANGIGELGDGAYTYRYTPEQVLSGTAISAVAAGNGHSLYIRSDGSLWGMGRNIYGQLGLGSVPSTNIQVQIVSSGVTAVAAGWEHSLFVKSDGSLWAMGFDGYGQLGDGSHGPDANVTAPKQIIFNGVKAVAAGEFHSLFIMSDGSLWGMGDNRYGQLGTNGFSDPIDESIIQPVPVQLVASNVVAVAAGWYHSLFIKSDGSLWGMGDNHYGQLGFGDTPSLSTPTRLVAGGVAARIILPSIASISLSGADLILNGANGVPAETIYVLMGTNIAQSLSSWDAVATNVLSAYGDFTITATNGVSPAASQRFFVLQVE